MTESEKTKLYEKAWDQVSDEHPMVCLCGKLCTGLHETYCGRFRKAVDSRYKKLLKEAEKNETLAL